MKSNISKKAITVFILLFLLIGLTACKPSPDGKYSVEDAQSGVELLKDVVDSLEENLTTSSTQNEQQGQIFLIQESGEYPPGMYAGRCAIKRKPEELTIGMTYEVIDISSQFMKWDEEVNKWVSVGQTTSPRNEREFASPPEAPRTGIYLGGFDPMRGPGKYELITTGKIENYVVEKAQTVGGGPVPRRISIEEVNEVIPFIIEN